MSFAETFEDWRDAESRALRTATLVHDRTLRDMHAPSRHELRALREQWSEAGSRLRVMVAQAVAASRELGASER